MTNGSASAPEPDGWHLAVFHGTTNSPDKATLNTLWRGGRGALFKLVFWTGLLTLLTLGLYRFWARTRIRRWYWSAIRPGGLPLEYTGSPYEKLLGFLVAVVILAFYIGVVNLILLFLSFSILAAPGAAYGLTLLGVVPIWFFATYRAQRYLLARTRWRGIRFGLAPGAWRYAALACWHWALTLATLGLWHPRLRFALARYRHERTYFGTQKFHQAGEPTLLYPAFIHVLIGAFLTAATLAMTAGDVATFFAALETEDAQSLAGIPPTWRMLLLSVPWLIYGLIHYGVEGRRLLIAQLYVGETRLEPRPRVARILWITIIGNVLRYVTVVALITALILGALALISPEALTGLEEETIDIAELFAAPFGALPQWVPILLSILGYFAIFLLWGALTQIFLTMPTWRHYAETLRLEGTGHLAEITQRDRDESREAGGFAEALDVGATI